MKKDSVIIRTIISIVMLINIILFPIGTTVTNSARINELLNIVRFEELFITVFKEYTINEIHKATNEPKEEIAPQVEEAMISETELREQREQSVIDYFDAIENGEVPNFRLELENPTNNLAEEFKEKAENFLVGNIGKVEVCQENPDSGICKTIGGLVGSLTGQDPFSNEEIPADPQDIINETLIIETSLGVTEDNINRISGTYTFLKYGPEALVVLTVVLMVIGYAITLPKRKFARKIIFTFIKLDFLAAGIWGFAPILFRSVNPIRYTTNMFNLEHTTVNSSVADIIVEMSKSAVMLPLIFTAAAVAVFVVTLIVNRMRGNVDEIIERRVENDEDYSQEDEIDSVVPVQYPPRQPTISNRDNSPPA
ncbi:hypothetical protein GF357_04700 [Candidatus Dojkabacteria bacterium]|nr:hypothetical protein [Candidatus Dojkabacteria bacterium]